MKIIKGSSNRNSKKVMEKMNQIFKSDSNSIIAITNDGPKFMSHHHYIEINNREQNNEG